MSDLFLGLVRHVYIINQVVKYHASIDCNFKNIFNIILMR